MPLKPLTRRQASVLRYIEKRIATGVPPTVREICAEFGFASPNAAFRYIKTLQFRGYLENYAGPVNHRTLRLSAAYKHARHGLPLVELEEIKR